jgi:hypothetical protein
MGTNYYLRENACPHCGRSSDEVHIGKSSAGWCFSLQVFEPYEDWTLDKWIERLNGEGTKIFDEYGAEYNTEEMLNVIQGRSWPCGTLGSQSYRDQGYRDEADFLEQNHAVRGPNNLLRHRIGPYCVGHGEGTYDYIPGDFC